MGLSPVGFHRNSPYTWYPEKYNLQLAPATAYKYIYKLPDKELQGLAYYFDDVNEQAAYKINVEKFSFELSYRIQIWRNAWFNSNELPQLHHMTDEDGDYVYDSRASIVRMHRLDNFEKSLLKQFSVPQLLKTVAGTVNSAEQFTLATKRLLKLGLLFVDEGRGISLVLKHRTEVSSVLATIKEKRPSCTDLIRWRDHVLGSGVTHHGLSR